MTFQIMILALAALGAIDIMYEIQLFGDHRIIDSGVLRFVLSSH